jgi:zona occludens toxin
MSIIAYVGLPGSGKSFDVVKSQILPGLAEGRRIVTNIPLNKDKVREKYPKGEIVDLPLDVIAQQPERLDDYATPGSVVVIDEVWRLWPMGLKADKIPQVFKSFLAEHRHKVDSQNRSMQIVLVTQDLSQIAAFARQLVEQTFHHTKLSHLGARGTYRIDIFHGAVTGAVPPVSNRLRELFGKYSPEVWKMYKSHTMSESKKSGADEVSMDTRGNIFKRPIIAFGAAFVVLGGAWGVYTLSGIVSGESGLGARHAPEPASPGTSRQTASLSPSSHGTPQPEPSIYGGWRVAGHVTWVSEGQTAGPGSFAFVTDEIRTFRVPYTDCFPRAFDTWCVFRGVVVSENGVVR